MTLWIWTLLGIYVVGFTFTFWLHTQTPGMHTLGLVLLRSSVWPIFLTTGRPHGSPLPMD